MEEQSKPQEYDFDNWTALEMFFHLIDLQQIPYEEEFEDWKYLKADMLRMCKESYKNQKDDTRSN